MRVLALPMLLSLLAACGGEDDIQQDVAHASGEGGQAQVESSEPTSVTGVLQHFPQDVKSVEAWLGHEFMIGDTPIYPTSKLPHKQLLSLVGDKVTIEGTWNPGEEREPAPEGAQTPTPFGSEDGPVMVGFGIEAESVTRAD